MNVVDASMAVLWTQRPEDDPRTTAAQDVMMPLFEDGVIVPRIFAYEMTNVIHHKTVVGRPVHRQERLRLALRMVMFEGQSMHEVAAVAERYDLSAYDAAYLELAERSGATLVTEDSRLHAAGASALGARRCLRLAESQERWGKAPATGPAEGRRD